MRGATNERRVKLKKLQRGEKERKRQRDRRGEERLNGRVSWRGMAEKP